MQKRQQRLLVNMKAIISEHEDNQSYGARRMLWALSQIDIHTSYSTVYRLMKKHGLLQKAKRHPNGITREDAAAQKSENLIQRDFSASAPNQKWLSVYFVKQKSPKKSCIFPHPSRGEFFSG
ncbi:IS3 family transposase [Cohnella hongkongensis]|uniref:IS3 family transposase n=1 Tax=Cohnella hongkongensis TaxID=178337 RepID=A0ABV9FLM7_9BACL